MPREIGRDELQKLVENGAQLVEVLPPKEYEEDHLPGAINMPLRHVDNAPQNLDPSRPVVVYCWDAA